MTEPVDIERLRKMVLATERYAWHTPFSEYDGDVRREDLDEIMRMLDILVAERDALKASCIDHMNTIGELTQDVEKLEVELERLRPIIELAQRASSQSSTCDDLFALREELEKIVGEP